MLEVARDWGIPAPDNEVERLKRVANRDLKGTRFALRNIGTGIVHAGPVVFIGHVVDARTHRHLVFIVVHREAITHPQHWLAEDVQLHATVTLLGGSLYFPPEPLKLVLSGISTPVLW